MLQMGTTVAAIQFEPKHLDCETNLNVATQLAFEAAAKGAKIIVLPELCISGLVIRSKSEAIQCAQTKDGYQTQRFIEIAREYQCYIIFGYIELYDGELFNSAIVIGPQGIAANTQKHNLYGPDNMWATRSEMLSPVISTPYGRIGVLICRDIMNKYRESYVFLKQGQKFYTKGSVDVVALLTNWGSEYGYPDSSWVELAEELDSNVIVSNRVGKEEDMKFKGGSCIVDRTLKVWTNGSSFTDNAVVGGIII